MEWSIKEGKECQVKVGNTCFNLTEEKKLLLLSEVKWSQKFIGKCQLFKIADLQSTLTVDLKLADIFEILWFIQDANRIVQLLKYVALYS